jgi:RimJ/RimL family protein N-acetyltransferase
VVSHILPRNAPSIRVAERLGARYARDADVRVKGSAPDP